MTHKLRRAGAILVAALLPIVAAAEDFEHSVTAEPGGMLRVELNGGAVVVESHAKPEVRVRAYSAGVGESSLDLQLRSDGDQVSLTGGASGWLGGILGGTLVRVQVRVPREFSVDIRTAGGSIEVEDLEGDVQTRTSGGRTAVDRVDGDVDVETSGGPIEADGIEGDVRARTSGGAIRLFDIEGRVDARTSGGPIEILGVEGDVRAETSGGSIRVRFLESPGGSLETSGGGIDVEFPADEGADLEAHTSGGRVVVDAELNPRGQVESNRVEAALNDGGDSLRVKTSGGSIHIRGR